MGHMYKHKQTGTVRESETNAHALIPRSMAGLAVCFISKHNHRVRSLCFLHLVNHIKSGPRCTACTARFWIAAEKLALSEVRP